MSCLDSLVIDFRVKQNLQRSLRRVSVRYLSSVVNSLKDNPFIFLKTFKYFICVFYSEAQLSRSASAAMLVKHASGKPTALVHPFANETQTLSTVQMQQIVDSEQNNR